MIAYTRSCNKEPLKVVKLLLLPFAEDLLDCYADFYKYMTTVGNLSKVSILHSGFILCDLIHKLLKPVGIYLSTSMGSATI